MKAARRSWRIYGHLTAIRLLPENFIHPFRLLPLRQLFYNEVSNLSINVPAVSGNGPPGDRFSRENQFFSLHEFRIFPGILRCRVVIIDMTEGRFSRLILPVFGGMVPFKAVYGLICHNDDILPDCNQASVSIKTAILNNQNIQNRYRAPSCHRF